LGSEKSWYAGKSAVAAMINSQIGIIKIS